MKITTTIVRVLMAGIIVFSFNRSNVVAQVNNVPNVSDYKKGNIIPFHTPLNQNAKAINLGKKTIKQRMDSTITEEYSDGTWKNIRKELFSYDIYGNCILTISADWVPGTFPGTFEWLTHYKSISAFDSKKNQTLSESYSWEPSKNKWDGLNKYEYFFDVNNNLTLEQHYSWNNSTEVWEPESKKRSIYILNGKNLIVQQIDSTWSSFYNIWKLYAKLDNTYDVNENLVSIVECRWDSGKWENYIKNDFTYDSRKNRISDIKYGWIGSNWKAFMKDEYTYDANNNLTYINSFYWDNNTGNWIAGDKLELTFDANGDPTLYIFYKWNYVNTQFEPKSKYIYTYNSAYSTSEIVFPYVNTFFKHMTTSAKIQQYVNNAWVDEERIAFYYSPFNFTGINKNEMLAAEDIYPNPSSGMITVNTDQLTIASLDVYDIKGKIVYKQSNMQIQNDIKLDLSALNEGVYFIHVQQEDSHLKIAKLLLVK